MPVIRENRFSDDHNSAEAALSSVLLLRTIISVSVATHLYQQVVMSHGRTMAPPSDGKITQIKARLLLTRVSDVGELGVANR